MRENASLCRPSTTYPVCEMYIHKQTGDWAKGPFANIHMICGKGQYSRHQKVQSGRGKSRPGHGLGEKWWGYRGSDRKRDKSLCGCREQWRERLVPGREELRCELWEGTFCSWLWGPTAQTDTGPSCLAQINPGGSRRMPLSLNTTSPPTNKHTHKYASTHLQFCKVLSLLKGFMSVDDRETISAGSANKQHTHMHVVHIFRSNCDIIISLLFLRHCFSFTVLHRCSHFLLVKYFFIFLPKQMQHPSLRSSRGWTKHQSKQLMHHTWTSSTKATAHLKHKLFLWSPPHQQFHTRGDIFSDFCSVLLTF